MSAESIVQHTPGPWHVDARITGTNITAQRGDDDRPSSLAAVHHDITMADGEYKANAHLIASAPDLLAALEYIAEWLEAHRPDCRENTVLCDHRECIEARRARAAIAKARGTAVTA